MRVPDLPMAARVNLLVRPPKSEFGYASALFSDFVPTRYDTSLPGLREQLLLAAWRFGSLDDLDAALLRQVTKCTNEKPRQIGLKILLPTLKVTLTAFASTYASS